MWPNDEASVTIGKTFEVVFSLADIITVIYYGELLVSGSPDEIRGHPKVRQAYLEGY